MPYLRIIGFLFLSHSLWGQYFSAISRPDSSFVPVKDSLYEMVHHISFPYLREHLEVFASDSFAGRAFNTPYNSKATRYLANQLQQMHVPPGNDSSYFQTIRYHKKFWEKIRFSEEKEGRVTHRFINNINFTSSYQDHFDSLDIRFNKVVILPCENSPASYMKYRREISGRVVVIWGCEANPEQDLIDYHPLLKALKKQGARLVLIVDSQLTKRIKKAHEQSYRGYKLSMGPAPLNPGLPGHLYVSPRLAAERFPALPLKRSWWQRWIYPRNLHTVRLPGTLHVVLVPRVLRYSGDNVLALIPGTDSAGEYLVLTAHPDHLPSYNNQIYNGADDNGSGSIALLAIASALKFAENKGYRPKKSILILWTNGEERGLLGSRYYVGHPILPLDKAYAEINIDMIGRVISRPDSVRNYLYVIGSDRISPQLHFLNESVNKNYSGLVLDYRYNAADDPNRYYYRSDHYNFAEKGIPSIFFFNGVHPDYHRPTDTIDKILWQVYESRVRHIFALVWTLANTTQPLSRYNQLR